VTDFENIKLWSHVYAIAERPCSTIQTWRPG
jgi:hypothetical protein